MRDFHRVEIIEALAGSGKTQELTYRYLRLMALGFDPKTILATTFSRKAAGEIRDRIIELLAMAMLDSSAMHVLQEGVPEIKDGRDGCESLLRQLIASLHRLNIGTIDSFFVKTAYAFSESLEMTPHWSILDDVHASEVFSDAVRRLTLDPSSTARLATLLRMSKNASKVPIHNTLFGLQSAAFSSVRDAKSEAWNWGTPYPTMSQEALAAAIDCLASAETEISKHQLDIPKAVAKLQRGEWKEFLTTGLASKVLDESFMYFKKSIDTDVVKALRPLVDHSLGVMANGIMSKNKSTYELMFDLHHCWISAKHERALYSFDDVTYRLSFMKLIENLIELQFRLDSSIDHMLIDEFQDTSLMQWDVLEPLIDEIHQSYDDRSLFFVGDVKQSLYGFRGGEPALLRQLPERLPESNNFRLDKSWRCSTPVLDAVNSIFEKMNDVPLLTEHAEFAAEQWLKNFEPHITARPKRKGYAVVQTASVDPDGRKSSLELCVEKVTEVVLRIHQDAPNATIGILVRSNTKQQIQRIVHALRNGKRSHVLAAEFGGNPLTDSPAVTVILSALLMSDAPGNTIARFHVCSSPLGDHLGITFSDTDRIHRISGTIRRRLLRLGYAHVINEFASHLVGSVGTRERLRLWQLVELAETHAGDSTLRPSDFVRLVEQTQVVDPASSQVQVMTIHKSKGLSFDAVILCDLDQPIWKTPRIMEKHKDLRLPPVRVGMYVGEYLDYKIPEYAEMREESHQRQVNDALCLLYVAMTRAKHALHIIIPSRVSKKHLKRLDSLLLQSLDEPPCQDPDTIVWKAEGSDDQWCDTVDRVDQHDQSPPIGPFNIQEPDIQSDPACVSVATAAPSSLEGGGRIHVGERFAGGTNRAFGWGTVVHKWFEGIDWFHGMIPSHQSLIESAPPTEAAILGAEQLRFAASSFIDAINDQDIQAILTQPQSDTAVFMEQQFVLRACKGTTFGGVKLVEQTNIHGSIDRLVVYYDEQGSPIRADVIDWKTDTIGQSGLDTKVLHYVPQLASYRLAAAKLLGIDITSVSAYLVFVSLKNVQDVTDKATIFIPPRVL